MKKLDVVGIGLSALDIVIQLEKMPTWEVPVMMDQVRFDGGGPTGTGLCAASCLGARAGFVGTAGNDWIAERKLSSLVEKGVDISQVKRFAGPENQIVFCFVDSKSGERVFSGVKTFAMNGLELDDLDKEYITSAEYLLMEGFHPNVTLSAASWMHEAGKKVMLDGGATNAEALDPYFQKLVSVTDVLICGSGFTEALTGLEDVQKAGNESLKFGPEITVVTEGAKGSYLFTQDEVSHTPVFPVDVVDTTGAGDTFHGAFIFGLLQGWDLRKISVFSTAASAIECMTLGGRAGLPDFDQVDAFLKERGFSL